MPSPRTIIKENALRILIGAAVAITPALLSYCQAANETKLKYQQASLHSEASYIELSKAVTQLQEAVKDQHDQLAMIQGYMTALDAINRQTLAKPAPVTKAAKAASETAAKINAETLDALRPAPTPTPDLDPPLAYDQAIVTPAPDTQFLQQ